MATITKLREPMAAAALLFLESLDGGARAAARHPLSRDRHRDWHYTPRDGRPGLPLKRMDAEQRSLVFMLLASALSKRGLHRTKEIIKLEGILGALTGRPDFRDPENYALAIFGDPAGKGPWGWRFEGHHVSLTFTIAPDLGIAVTPAFFGANPAEVPAGHEHAGLRVLAVKQDLALALLHDLSSTQQQTARPGRAGAALPAGGGTGEAAFRGGGGDRARHLPLLPAARADFAGRVRQHRAQPHPHGVA